MGDVDPNWPSYLGDTFATTLVQYSQSIGADPLGILKLLINESGGRLNPNAQNPNGFPSGQYAVGINQFAPVSWGFFAPLTAVQYGQLTAEQQLPYVFGYFKHWMNAYGLSTISPRDLYWLNFLPATYVPNATDLHVIVTSSSGNYQNNQSLDHGHKGFITAGDLQLTIDGMSSNSMYKLIAPYVLEEVGGPTLPVAALMVAAGLWAGYKIAQSGALDAFIPNLSNLLPV
jgi:hypothetical protein